MTYSQSIADSDRGILLFLGTVFLTVGAYGFYFVLTYTPVGGQPTHAPRGLLPIGMVSALIVLLGVMLVSQALVFPSGSPQSIFPDLQFSSWQRKSVVYGSLCVGVGPIVAAVVVLLIPSLLVYVLGILPLLLAIGFGLVLVGFGGRIFDYVFKND